MWWEIYECGAVQFHNSCLSEGLLDKRLPGYPKALKRSDIHRSNCLPELQPDLSFPLQVSHFKYIFSCFPDPLIKATGGIQWPLLEEGEHCQSLPVFHELQKPGKFLVQFHRKVLKIRGSRGKNHKMKKLNLLECNSKSYFSSALRDKIQPQISYPNETTNEADNKI